MFDSTIYGHFSVKDALKSAQHRKCAYCEGRFEAFAAGDVEHFRPKAFSQQIEGGEKFYPGYYWLVYEWSNLLYSCEPCNRALKRNVFPLANPRGRARKSSDPLSAERPLLIDPASGEDPRAHIRFSLHVAVGQTRRGSVTIRLMRLDRVALDVARLDHIKQIETLNRLANIDPTQPGLPLELPDLIRSAREQLAELIRPEAQFSAAAEDYLMAKNG